MKLKHIYTLFCALATALLPSCAADDPIEVAQPEEGGTLLRLNVRMADTRAGLDDTQFTEGDEAMVVVTNHGSEEKVLVDVKATYTDGEWQLAQPLDLATLATQYGVPGSRFVITLAYPYSLYSRTRIESLLTKDERYPDEEVRVPAFVSEYSYARDMMLGTAFNVTPEQPVADITVNRILSRIHLSFVNKRKDNVTIKSLESYGFPASGWTISECLSNNGRPFYVNYEWSPYRLTMNWTELTVQPGETQTVDVITAPTAGQQLDIYRGLLPELNDAQAYLATSELYYKNCQDKYNEAVSGGNSAEIEEATRNLSHAETEYVLALQILEGVEKDLSAIVENWTFTCSDGKTIKFNLPILYPGNKYSYTINLTEEQTEPGGDDPVVEDEHPGLYLGTKADNGKPLVWAKYNVGADDENVWGTEYTEAELSATYNIIWDGWRLPTAMELLGLKYNYQSFPKKGSKNNTVYFGFLAWSDDSSRGIKIPANTSSVANLWTNEHQKFYLGNSGGNKADCGVNWPFEDTKCYVRLVKEIEESEIEKYLE